MEKNKSSLKSRILLIYVSLIVIIGVLGAVSVSSLDNISRSVSSLITTNYNSIDRIAQMEAALKEQRLDMLLYIYDDDANKQVLNFQNHHAKFMSYYNKEYDTIVLPNEIKIIIDIKSKYDSFVKTFQTLQTFDTSNPSSQTFNDALNYYAKDVTLKYDNTLTTLAELRTSNATALFARRDETYNIIQNTTYLLFFMFIFAAVISFITFRHYLNKLFGPIYEITQNLKSVRQGNINRKAIIQNTDELGALCNEFNNMTQRLSEFEQSTLGSLMDERNKTFAIVKSIAEPMLILDSKHHVILLNDSFEKLLNAPVDALDDIHFLDVISGSCFADVASKIDYKATNYWNGVVKITYDWKPKYYNVMVSPITYENGEEKNFVIIVFYDITEMKLLEKMRTDFIATISHEFKTPLTSIVMGADLLSNTNIGQLNKDQNEIVDTIKEESQQLNLLVNDLLELSKVEASNILYQFKPVAMINAIEKCVKQFKPRAKNLGIGLEIAVQNALPKVNADFSKIVWVLNNLVSNALKYTTTGDTIKISAELLDASTVRICVEDNGTGIPSEFLEKIFDKYVQVPGCDIETRGTGLGLAVAKDIILTHKGRIWCESDINSGSKFYFILPISD